MVGARFLYADFMRINLACEATYCLPYAPFLHSRGAAARTVIAMQDGGTGTGAQHGGAGREANLILSCHRTSMWDPPVGGLFGFKFSSRPHFLTSVSNGRSNRPVNNYATTLQCLVKSARNRGRFQGENPFEDQRRKAGGEKREAFTAAELHKIFASLPPDIAPAKHSPESALPWAVRIAAYTGMRLEE